MALNVTNFNSALKRHYHERRVKNLAERANTFYGMVRKNEDVGGEGIKTPLIHRNPTGGSAVYANALANAAEGGYGHFLQSHNDHFHVVKIDHKVIKLSSYKEAFLKATTEIDRGIKEATNGLSRKLFRTTGGSMGRMANTSFATTALVLQDKEDIYNFQKNEVLVLDDNEDGSSIRGGSPGTLTVAGIERGTGTITTTANISSAITSPASLDYLFKEGDQNKGWTGLASFIPGDATDAATTLHGLVRADDVERLGGYRLDAAALGYDLEQAAIEMAALIGAEGGDPDYLFVNPFAFKDFSLLVNSGRASRRDVKSQTGYVSYRGIVIQGPKGDITVLSDVNCPINRAYMLTMDSWEMKTAGKAPHIVDDDGLMMVRLDGTIDFKVDFYAYGDMTCDSPGANGVILL